MVSIDLPADAGPFSLVSRQVLDIVNAMPEFNRYYPGLRAFAGFHQVAVPVERNERLAGETKYSLRARSAGALNAIVSFSKLPAAVRQRPRPDRRVHLDPRRDLRRGLHARRRGPRARMGVGDGRACSCSPGCSC